MCHADSCDFESHLKSSHALHVKQHVRHGELHEVDGYGLVTTTQFNDHAFMRTARSEVEGEARRKARSCRAKP